MHEISIVHSIIGTLEEKFTRKEIERITAIELKVGKLSNVEPILLQNALEAVQVGEQRLQAARLEIEVIPVEIFCADCDKHSTIEQYIFVCAYCGQPNNNIVRGLELLIHGVYFEEEEDTTA